MAAGPDGSAQVLDATLADDPRVKADLKTIRVTCFRWDKPSGCRRLSRVGEGRVCFHRAIQKFGSCARCGGECVFAGPDLHQLRSRVPWLRFIPITRGTRYSANGISDALQILEE